MTWYLCDEWAPSSGNDAPCVAFEMIPYAFTGPEIDYLDQAYIRCTTHTGATLTELDSADDYYDALADIWNDSGFHACESCGARTDDIFQHLLDFRFCATHLNDRWRSYQAYFHGAEDDPDNQWWSILRHHNLPPFFGWPEDAEPDPPVVVLTIRDVWLAA